jgi:hypothetical protein
VIYIKIYFPTFGVIKSLHPKEFKSDLKAAGVAAWLHSGTIPTLAAAVVDSQLGAERARECSPSDNKAQQTALFPQRVRAAITQ